MINLIKRLTLNIFLFVVILGLTGCSDSKKVLTTEDVMEKLESSGFTTEDLTSMYADSKIDFKAISKFVDAENRFQIIFYELNSVQDAKESYSANKYKFMEYYNNNYSTEEYVDDENSSPKVPYTKKEKFGENYATFTLQTTNSYCFLSRIDNTFIYVYANIDYKGEIQKVLKKLG